MLANSVNRVRQFFDWLVRMYWGDPISAQRHTVEEDARRLGGRVVWDDLA